MTAATITWTKDWSTAPFVDASVCTHPGSASMAIGLELVKASRGRSSISTRATFCMLCGIDSSGRMPADEALQAAWMEHGWHKSTGERLLEFSRRGITGGEQ